MMDNDYYVYVYCDPRKNNEPFYVGMGHERRYLDHLTETLKKSPNKRKIYKIESIRKDGQEPYIFKYAEDLSRDCAFELEDFLIVAWGRKDFDENGILFNILEAGRRSPSISGSDHYNWGKTGAMLGRHLTDDQVERLRQSKLGVKREPFSDKWRANMSAAATGENNSMYGRNHRPESIELIRIKAMARRNSKESNEKRSETNKKLAKERAQRIIPYIEEILSEGDFGPQQIANKLNEQGLRTDRDKIWKSCSIKRILIYMKGK